MARSRTRVKNNKIAYEKISLKMMNLIDEYTGIDKIENYSTYDVFNAIFLVLILVLF